MSNTTAVSFPAAQEVTTESVEVRLSKARLWLVSRLPFFGYLTLRMSFDPGAAERYRIPTAGVTPDGTLFFNQKFANTLPDSVFRWVLAHEVLHPALDAFARMGSRSKTKWNDAHDYALNMILKEYAESMGQDSTAFKPWEHQLCDTATYGGMSAEQIYDLLPEQPPGHEPLMADMRPDLSSTADGRKAARGCTAAKTKLKHQWATAVHTAAQMHEQQRNGQGSLPAGVRKYIDSLLNPTVRWDEYLQDYLGERLGEVQMTYSSLNRRSEAAGVILAGRRRRNSPDVTVLWDTSGSQVGWETRVLSEIQGICEELNAEVRVIIIDTAIYADVGIEDAEDIIADVEGGGGSDFRPAFTRLDEESDSSVVLAFTDGYIGVPECPPPQLQDVLWVITEGGVKPADYGSCIHITKNGEVVK